MKEIIVGYNSKGQALKAVITSEPASAENKRGRPAFLGIKANGKQDYNKKYIAKRRLVFSVNLDLEKDKELIDILNSYKQGNRQGAIKELCLIGYQAVNKGFKPE